MATSDYKKRSQAQHMADYGIKPAGIKQGETLMQAYRRLAKQADQRLVRLEAASREKGYEGILTYSYGLAAHDAAAYGSDLSRPRFNIAPPPTEKQLQAKVNDIIRFLNSPTSTKSGVTAMYKKRTETLNKKYGTNFTWQEAGRFFEEKKDSFNKDWNSSLILKSIGKMQKSAEKIRSEMAASADAHKVVSDAKINDAIYEKLKSNGIDAASLFGEIAPQEIQDLFADRTGKTEPVSKTTAIKRTQPTKKTAKSRHSKKANYAGKTIAQIIRAVGQRLIRRRR